jgi:hypothetical protein
VQPAVPEVKLVNELLAGVEPVEGDSMLVEGFLVIAELVRPVQDPIRRLSASENSCRWARSQRANASSIATANCQCPVPRVTGC